MADGLEPIGLAVVVCDAIHIDPGTAKRTLLGLFSTIFAPVFPATVGQMAVYVSITECRGQFPIALQIVDVNEEREPLVRAEGEVLASDPLAILDVDFRFGNVVFPEPGEYRVQFYAAGAPIIERRILVSSLPTGGPVHDE